MGNLPRVKPPAASAGGRSAMKNRVVRVDDPTWDAAAARAERDGVPLSQVVRHYLREYGRKG